MDDRNVTLRIESKEALLELLAHPDPYLPKEGDWVYAVECVCGKTHVWKTLEEIPGTSTVCECGHCLIVYDKNTE